MGDNLIAAAVTVASTLLAGWFGLYKFLAARRADDRKHKREQLQENERLKLDMMEFVEERVQSYIIRLEENIKRLEETNQRLENEVSHLAQQRDQFRSIAHSLVSELSRFDDEAAKRHRDRLK